ncbi:unnamed protein product [Clavelina lepadiformis]|uniref:Uncharacterized protein n=1 Tax=Clavelina lepadiformis TaxID=159417 RepID=A0ABP0GX21_CLALP
MTTFSTHFHLMSRKLSNLLWNFSRYLIKSLGKLVHKLQLCLMSYLSPTLHLVNVKTSNNCGEIHGIRSFLSEIQNQLNLRLSRPVSKNAVSESSCHNKEK